LGALNELALTYAVAASQSQVLLTLTSVSSPVYSSCIDRYIPSPHKEELLILSSNFLSSSVLEFYTDGSLKDVGLPSIRMGIAWLQTHQSSPMVSFNTSFASSFPSSSIPEFTALFTALLTAPHNCNIKIFTDSAVIISQFNKYNFLLQQAPTFRPLLKINNLVHWSCLFDLISTRNLDVKLIKVKAHSNNLLNNKVDAMAKAALSLPIMQLLTNAAPQCFFKYHNQPVLIPTRQFVKEIFRHKHL
jgi:ribonuclease HI